jgi:hypothetical protein
LLAKAPAPSGQASWPRCPGKRGTVVVMVASHSVGGLESSQRWAFERPNRKKGATDGDRVEVMHDVGGGGEVVAAEAWVVAGGVLEGEERCTRRERRSPFARTMQDYMI